jgi:hypothetical protein
MSGVYLFAKPLLRVFDERIDEPACAGRYRATTAHVSESGRLELASLGVCTQLYLRKARK